MRNHKGKTGVVACWLVPAALAAPFIAALAVLMARCGAVLKEAVEVVAKLVVIP